MDLHKSLINDFCRTYWFDKNRSKAYGVEKLVEAVTYSLNNRGKRFRPVLCLHVAEALGQDQEFYRQRALPFACAVEFIHTYSLIHDDLPAMDNDDLRRGQPTNHRVFGEDFALLSGDALLTEAFTLIVDHYSYNPQLAMELVKLLSQRAGIAGMVGGQAIDLKAQVHGLDDMKLLNELHLLKTGALISCSVEGAALICEVNTAEIDKWREYGNCLGLAFQVADDILDYDEKNIEKGSYPGLVGLERSQRLLKDLSGQARQILSELPKKSEDSSMPLIEIVNYNERRCV